MHTEMQEIANLLNALEQEGIECTFRNDPEDWGVSLFFGNRHYLDWSLPENKWVVREI